MDKEFRYKQLTWYSKLVIKIIIIATRIIIQTTRITKKILISIISIITKKIVTTRIRIGQGRRNLIDITALRWNEDQIVRNTNFEE